VCGARACRVDADSVFGSRLALLTSRLNILIFFCSPTHVYLSKNAVVSWKKPSSYSRDDSYYEPSWLVAENLDQNSLASAFRMFPMDADPDRREAKGKMEEDEEEAQDLDLQDDFSDDDEEESDEEESDEEEDVMDKSSDDMMPEYEEEDGGKYVDISKDAEISHLEDSGKFVQTFVERTL
jgi:hypothetical protein